MDELSGYERNKRYIAELMSRCASAKDDHETSPIFRVGDLVCHKHRSSIRGNVRQWGREKTIIAISFGWHTKIETFFTDHLELAKSRDDQKNQKRKNKKKAKNANQENLLHPVRPFPCPAVFVDASTKGEQSWIAAVAIGYYRQELFHAFEKTKIRNSNCAERAAIDLGIEIRLSESWPVYADAQGQVVKHPGPNVLWIPRHGNLLADQMARYARTLDP